MKNKGRSWEGRKGFTRLDLIVVVVVVSLLALLVVPGFLKAQSKAKRMSCVGHLMQLGLAFRIFATDHQDRFPMQESTNQGGSFDYSMTGDVFRHYQVLSNLLIIPLILRCFSDRRTVATNFSNLAHNAQVSYFVGLDAAIVEPGMLLSGDRNLTGLAASSNHIFILESTNTLGWSKELHQGSGNVLLSDGSVQQGFPWSYHSWTGEPKMPQRLAVP